jgi:hypothetical protein
MIAEVLAILRLEDSEILRLYREEPDLCVMLAVQERIWDLHVSRDPLLQKYTTQVTLVKVDSLPEHLKGPQYMLKQFVLSMYSKNFKVNEAKRIAEVTSIASNRQFRALLTYLVIRKRFTKDEIERHLEHRYHAYLFKRLEEEEYIKPTWYGKDEGRYYATWKAEALVSDWRKYGLDKRGY